jgi:ABC-2 type transport system permease protein
MPAATARDTAGKRGLLLDTPVGSSGWLAPAWCGGLLVFSYAVASALFRSRTAR